MSFFNSTVPIFARKASAFDIQDLPGLWRVHWQMNQFIVLSTFYTRHDQACLLWGLIAVVIFTTAQFLPFGWTSQIVLSSALTVLGTIAMVVLTRRFTITERLSWVLASWAILILAGILITDLSIFGVGGRCC